MAKEQKSKGGRPKQAVRLEIQAVTRLDTATNERLNTAAHKLDRAPAWVIRKALEEWLERNGYPTKA